MQFSNGLTNPAGLWLGHLFFDGIFGIVLATIIIIVFAVASNQFHGLGYLVRSFTIKRICVPIILMQWFIFVLYGLASALFSYCFSLISSSPLAAFAAVAGYQCIMFIVRNIGHTSFLITHLLVDLLGSVPAYSHIRQEFPS